MEASRSKDSSLWIVKPVKDKRMVATDDDTRRIVERPQGDQSAFEALIREHQRMIHSLCYRMTGSLADAEDLALPMRVPPPLAPEGWSW